MNAEIVSIGTELAAGMTVDTNAAWLSSALLAHGLRVSRHVTVPDDRSAICGEVRRAADSATFVIINGGLGPTGDDLTRQAVADAAGVPLVQDLESLDRIRAFFERMGRSMAESNAVQSYYPEGGAMLENTCGTAPGFRVGIGRAEVFALPGVPYEMKEMYLQAVDPVIASSAAGATTVTRTVRCFGASESGIAERINDLMQPGREPVVGITAKDAVISVRIIARGTDRSSTCAAADADEKEVKDRLGKLVFGAEDDTLASAVGALLAAGGLTAATAESCTGGLLAKLFTDVPGSSGYFLGGFVTYADREKNRVLDVPEPLISTHGAVSEEVATAMAKGCRNATGADFALSTTGIAGPGGGTAEKPVGLVYVSLAGVDGAETRKLQIGQHVDRAAIRDRTCKVILNLLRLELITRSGT